MDQKIYLTFFNFDLKYIHSEASPGIRYKVDFCNLIRPGIIMYGYESADSVKKVIDIEPICKLKSKITFLKEIDYGDILDHILLIKILRQLQLIQVMQMV